MFKLRIQLFIVLFLLTSALTAGFYIFLKINFKRDFWHYIEKKETRFAQPIINDLIDHYREEKNWLWINDWDEYLSQHLLREIDKKPNVLPKPDDDDDLASRSKQLTGNDRRFQPPPASDWREFRHSPPHEAIHHFYLLDSDKKIVAGKLTHSQNNLLLPLKIDDQTIGYLGVPFNPAFRDLPDINFATGQEKKFALIVIVAILLASFVALPLAHFMTQRIKNLQQQVEYMNQGHYDKKISTKGSDELSLLAVNLNNLAETLAQSETARRQWVADISHELRTPIAVLQAELEAVEDGVRPMDKKSIQRLSEHCLRLKRLVNDLYELSLTDLGGMSYRKTMLNLTELIQSTTNTFQSQFAKQNIEFKMRMTDEPAFVFGDQDRLVQLLSNLLKNSVQYTNSPGQAILMFSVQDNTAELIIEDSAPGVSSETHAKLFDRLYRGESSRNRSTGGAGLGLSICHNIVAAHDAKISISNSSLGGLKISIIFPIKRAYS